MPHNTDKLLTLTAQFEEQANDETIIVEAKKDSKKLDPKAEVRNRGKVVFDAKSPKVKDNKDHFTLNDIGEARNALSRSHQYDKAPPWYNGSLSSLQEAVRRAVKKHYPSIEVSEPKKK